MVDEVETLRVAGPADRVTVETLASQAFGVSRDDASSWVEMSGLETWRVFEGPGGIDACLMLVSMGQRVGGQRVAMEGVVGVAGFCRVVLSW